MNYQSGITLSHNPTHLLFKTVSFSVLLLVSIWPAAMSLVATDRGINWGINEAVIAEQISPSLHKGTYPESINIPGLDLGGELKVSYTIDRDLQNEADRLLQKYRPDYGVIVAMDPEDGRILAMADNTRDGSKPDNLALQNSFPAASISKIITAIAAIEENVAKAGTKIPFNGKSTTLYKKHVFKHTKTKWTRNFSLKESFAKSVNTVFGRLGAVDLGGNRMMEYAEKLGFNARFASDFTFDNGVVELDTSDEWQVAEMASGYTTRNTLSPVHAVTLAATAVNGGNLVAPVLVDQVTGPNGIPLYVYQEPATSEVMNQDSANQLKSLMESTVKIGSARKSFRKFHRREYETVAVGGKTGSLTGYAPKGKYDWFVGFGESDGQKIAFAALCINKEKWYVKSAQLARELLEFYYDADRLAEAESTG